MSWSGSLAPQTLLQDTEQRRPPKKRTGGRERERADQEWTGTGGPRGQPFRTGMQRDAGRGGGPHDSSQSAGCNDGGDVRRAERRIPAEPDTLHHKPATERETPLLLG